VTAIFGVQSGGVGRTLHSFLERVYEDDREHVLRSINSSIREKSDFHAEFRTAWPDGSIHYISVSGQLIECSIEMPMRLVGVCTDMTKQIMEQENAKRLVMLEQHEDFIATLSHDLKNPLIGADRLLDMYLNHNFGSVDEEQRKVLSVIKQSNSEILALLQNLLEVYRFDAGAPPLNLVPTEIDRLATSCVNNMKVCAEEGGVKLGLDFDASDHTVAVDPVAIRRVMINLLSNAIKFTGSGGTVTVSGRLGEKSYVLNVQDSGSGIAPQDMELLFRRFSQTTLGRRYESGTGLGLYLCRQLVEAHQGTITCNSAEGSGSTFTIDLPIEQPQ
jgi:signal transduction histidine kinase